MRPVTTLRTHNISYRCDAVDDARKLCPRLSNFTVHTATPSRVAPPPPVHIGRVQNKITGFPRTTAANVVMVSGKALPASRGNNGVVHAILDVSRYFSVEWYQFLLFFIVDGKYVSCCNCTILVGLRPIIISRYVLLASD